MKKLFTLLLAGLGTMSMMAQSPIENLEGTWEFEFIDYYSDKSYTRTFEAVVEDDNEVWFNYIGTADEANYKLASFFGTYNSFAGVLTFTEGYVGIFGSKDYEIYQIPGKIYREGNQLKHNSYDLTAVYKDMSLVFQQSDPGIFFEAYQGDDSVGGFDAFEILRATQLISTGIAEINVEGNAKYYNLQGIELSAPEKGTVCIKVEGNKSTKILIK